MKRSTIARIALISYGLNFSALWLGVIVHNWLFVSLSGLWIVLISHWFEKNYFDKENTDAVHKERD